jgi:hypothetical protein
VILEKEEIEQASGEEEIGFGSAKKVFLAILFIGSSFLVFNVGGYNNFIPNDMVLPTRTIVVGILLLSTLILYKAESRANEFWKISFAFLISSIGLFLAWPFGRWYTLIPGLSTSTVEGVALAKLAEVIPIVVAIVVGIRLVERNLTPVFITGGDLRKTFKLGLIISPIALVPFLALGGLSLSVSLDVLASWMPWMCIFAFSNAFMEELMIRGLFLMKYDSLFGQRQSLILTSSIFAIFHQAILQYTDPVTFSAFLGITFMLGLAWGYIMQKSDSIWGAVLAHAIADILLLFTVFGV